jgi:hypothetical protein
MVRYFFVNPRTKRVVNAQLAYGRKVINALYRTPTLYHLVESEHYKRLVKNIVKRENAAK